VLGHGWSLEEGELRREASGCWGWLLEIPRRRDRAEQRSSGRISRAHV
jgi:hypothetical protein